MEDKKTVGWKARVVCMGSLQTTKRYTTQADLIEAIVRERICDHGSEIRIIRVVRYKRLEADAVLEFSGGGAFLRFFNAKGSQSNREAARELGFNIGDTVKVKIVRVKKAKGTAG